MFFSDKIISKYQSASSTVGLSVSLTAELGNIANGMYKPQILLCREQLECGNAAEYKKRKTLLPAITFSGEFKGSHKKENLVNYSNVITIDIDAIDKENLDSVKQSLFQDKYVFAIWVSPSGRGLKVLFQVSNLADEHKKCFDVLSNYLETKFNINVDKSGSDICRLCFVSFDDRILIRKSCEVFDYKDFTTLQLANNTEASEVKIIEKDFTTTQQHSESKIFKSTEGRNLQRNRESIVKVIKFLKKSNSSITSNYSDWFRVACAVANSFTYELGRKYYLDLCRLDGVLHDEYKSENLLEYCYRNRRINSVEFSTIIYLAKKKGFIATR